MAKAKRPKKKTKKNVVLASNTHPSKNPDSRGELSLLLQDGKAKIGFAVFLVLDALFLIFLGASTFLGTPDARLPVLRLSIFVFTLFIGTIAAVSTCLTSRNCDIGQSCIVFFCVDQLSTRGQQDNNQNYNPNYNSNYNQNSPNMYNPNYNPNYAQNGYNSNYNPPYGSSNNGK